MSKRIFFAVLVLLIAFSSFSITSANDINITGISQQSQIDDNVVSTADVEEVQGYSNNLSTNNLNSFDDHTIGSGNVSVNIDVPDVELYYKNGTRLIASLSDVDGNALANQSLIFELNNQNYTRNTNDLGQASIAVNLNPGNYSVKLYYLGDGTYLNNSAEASISVLPTMFADDVVKYFKNDTQYYVLLVDAYGNPLVNATATMNINGRFYNRTTDDKGFAKLSINLPEGTYILTAYHPYTNGTISNTITVLPTIYADNIIKYYKNDTQYYATFLDGTGNPLHNTEVAFNINGVFYTRTTNNEGIAKLNINLADGVYVLTAYNPINDDKISSTIEVLPVVYADDITKIYRDNRKFNALFVTGLGDPITDANVTFNINGRFYDRTTDEYGIAGLNINLLPGTYIITAYHPNGYAKANTVTILSSSTTTLTTNNYEFNLGDNKTIKFELYNQLGYGVNNQTVYVTANGTVYTAITDSEGVGTVTLDLDYGIYEVVYEFNGEDRYEPSVNIGSVEVYEGFNSSLIADDTILYANNSETFNVTLLDGDDNPIVGETVYIGAEGSKMYSRTTDSNGTARLTINWGSGNYNMLSVFNATGYKPVSVYSVLTVIKDNVSSFSTKNLTVGHGFSEKLIAGLNVGDVPLIGRKVTLTINGVNYTRTTDENGMISIDINLPVGSYVVDYYYNGEERIAPSIGQAFVTVKERSPTSVTWSSPTSFVEGSTSSLQVKLADAKGNPLYGEDIVYIISSREYYATTNAEGIASLPRTFSSGVYYVSYKFEGDNDYAPSEGTIEIIVAAVNKNTYGYWAFGRDMYNINLDSLSSLGTGNIFLNFAALGLYGKSEVTSWIKTASTYGINVHIWMQAFYDSGNWVNPVSGGSPNQAYFNQKINEAKDYAALDGVAGIHLDYLRYPSDAYRTSGSSDAINEFVRQLTAAVKEVNSKIIVSAAVMPETTNDVYYYGQDIPTLSKYLDVIVPMQYKGNYGSGTSWLTSTTKWFVSASQGAQIWSGLQGYVSDDNTARLSIAELSNDAQTVLDAGAAGVVIFRFGITSYIDFSGLDNPSYGGFVSTEDIVSTASNLKEYIESNGVLPNNIAVGDEYYTIPQVLEMMAGAIMKLNGQLESDIVSQIVAIPDNSQGDDIYASIYETDYLQVARDVYSYCLNQKQAPGSINSSSGLIKYETLIYMLSKVLAFYDSYDEFPLTVTINNLLDHYNLTVSMYPSAVNTGYAYLNYTTTWLNYCPNCGIYGTLLINPKHTEEGELTCSHCDCDYCGVSGFEKVYDSVNILTRLSDSVPVSEGDIGVNVPIDSIIEGAVYLKSYIKENNALPDYVVLSVGKYTMPQFLYLMGRAISNINSGILTPIAIVDSNSPSSPSGDYINASLSKDGYVDVATRVADFIVANSQAPNYASSTLGKIAYAELLDSFSRILNYYLAYSTLPSSVIIDYVAPSAQSILDLAKSLTNGLTSDRDKATALFNYVRDNIAYSFYYNTQKGAEGTLIAGYGNCCDQSQLLVAMARSIGLTVRFATGYCTFSSGSYGHVWVQFNIDGSWINADPVSNRNSFGVINNWNTNTYTSRGVYDILPY